MVSQGHSWWARPSAPAAVFHKGNITSNSHMAIQSFQFLTPFSEHLFCVVSWMCERVSDCEFHGHFSSNRWWWAFLMCLLPICVFLGENKACLGSLLTLWSTLSKVWVSCLLHFTSYSVLEIAPCAACSIFTDSVIFPCVICSSGVISTKSLWRTAH